MRLTGTSVAGAWAQVAPTDGETADQRRALHGILAARRDEAGHSAARSPACNLEQRRVVSASVAASSRTATPASPSRTMTIV